MKKLFLFSLIFMLSACARQVMPPQEQSSADRLWQAMQAAGANKPFRLQLSMRFGEEGNTRRVTALLWGNDTSDIRLDVQAGVGATVAMISEAGDDFLLYTPRDNSAWEHSGPNRPMLKIGVPVPFDLAQLAALLTGSFSPVFGSEPESAAPGKDGGAEFELRTPPGGTLLLNARSEPVSWVQTGGPWKLSLAYDEETPFLPKSVRLENRDGKRAIILVKERESPEQPFTAEQLKLTVPASAKVRPLSEYKPS